jgi:cellulose synthase/poly-beta-1,6-N-acetylglucosamine synthase-like glycosyltransferase/peptidoglycan/xylan/chitin deacetylase (PgdA/CDA1 family)
VIGIAVLLLIAAMVGLGLPQMYRAPRLEGLHGAVMPAIDTRSAEVLVGSGPLVRVLRVHHEGSKVVGYDAASGERVAELTGDDAARARGHDQVMQRYGYGNARRTMSLTFDDGPDPKYTPDLLDLLSREHVPATFFDIGTAAVQHPDLVRREAREGHLVANHTMTHLQISNAPSWRTQAELVSTDRTLRALTGQGTPFLRLPYEGDDEQSTTESIDGVARAQQLGYVVASHDYDSMDWAHAKDPKMGPIPLPPLAGQNMTVLLHDGGGDRHLTLGYVARLITYARSQGYSFTTMARSENEVVPPSETVRSNRWDSITLFAATVAFAWPVRLLDTLFLFALSTVLMGLIYSVLALIRKARRRRLSFPSPSEFELPVSVVLAAYNEEGVIRRTVEMILASDYPIAEVLVVDDGSADRTASIVTELAAGDPRVRLMKQQNAGKAGALNRGIAAAVGDVIVTMDADTVMGRSTVGNLVRHFAVDLDGRLGAVAGVIRVGNRKRNLLTRWQALEYLTQIGVERSAQDLLGAIAIVPGACAAWRKAAILSVGGYSNDTLAEDCDLSLAMHRAGWKVTQDDEAIAFTEAPEDLDGLLAQRTRWAYGTLQAIHKHRDMLFRGRYGWLGFLVLPNYVLSILMPIIFLPLTTIMAVMMVQQQGWWALGLYALVFTAAHVLVAAVAVAVMKESPRHLLMVPVYRLVFEPLRAYLLYTSAYMAIRGVHAGWNKLARTGVMDTGAITLSAVASAAAARPNVVDLRDPVPGRQAAGIGTGRLP